MARKSDIRLRRSAVSGSIPTTSNLNLGELALNTADGKVYMKKSVGGTDTVIEVGAGGGIAASFIGYEYTATANQTTFTGSDNYSNTLAYNTGTPPAVQVFMNGILLDEGSSADYTATNGTSVVLTSSADAGDLIQIHAYKSDVSVVADLSFADNQKLKFGDSSDLQIFHDGTRSIINDVGTGNLQFQVGGTAIYDVTTDGIVLADGLDVEANEFIGDLRGSVLFKAQAGEALSKGDVVTITGISGNTTVVSKADANVASLMPAFGVAAETVSINNPVDIYSFGIMTNLTTNINGWTEGSPLYVSTTPGEMTDVPPSGSTSLVQQIAKITKIHASTGSIDITGAGRANATPNLDEGKIFVGNSSNRSVQVDSTINVDMANSQVLIDNTLKLGSSGQLEVYHDGSNGVLNNTSGHLQIYNNADDGDIQFISDNGSGGTQEYFRVDGGADRTIFSRSTRHADNIVGSYGTSEDLQIYHDTNHSYIRNYTGNLYIDQTLNDADILLRSDDGSGGVATYFQLDGSQTQLKVHKNMVFFDSISATFGSGADATILHDGSHFRLRAGTGNFNVQANDFHITDASNTTVRFKVDHDGATSIRYNGSEKLATKSDGVDVTGELQSDSLDVDGNGDISGNLTVGSVTSTGVVSAEDNIYLTDAGTVRGKLLLNASDRDNVELRAESLGSTMKFFTVGTQALLLDASQNATFAGTISSGAITSSGAIVGSTVQSTGNLFGTNGLHTLNTAGNGWDHTINRNGGSPTANLPGGITSGNITTTGYLRGPSTFTIDPAAHGDDTGTVVIAGNLQIDGTTTTINSTTLTVDDKNITLASGAANAAAANGAGLTVAGASANIVYESINDRWTLNKEVFSSQGFMIGTTSTDVGLIKNSSGVFDFQAQSTREISFSNVTNGEHVRIDADGNLGIGTNNPQTKLHVEGITRITESNNTAFYGGDYVRVFGNQYFNFRNTGGSTIARIHMAGDSYFNGGDVGIGTTAPSKKLHVEDSSGYQLQLDGGTNYWNVGAGWSGYYDGSFLIANNTGDKLVISSTGKVGIGTNSPGRKLTVQGASGDNLPVRIIGGSGTSHGSMEFQDPNTTADYKVTVGSKGDDFYIQAGGSEKVRVNSAGNVGVGVTSIPSWANLITDGTVAVGGTLYMKTGNPIQALSAFPGGAADLKMQTGGGKVTIGGPGGSTTGHLELYGRYSGSDPKLSFRSDHPTAGNTTVWDMARITADDGGNYNGVLHFQVAAGNGSENNGAPLATAMTIQDTKYVGIGTEQPADKLHISGGNILLNNALEIRTKDTGGNIRTIMRANSSNELEYGWSANAPVKFMGGGSYTERMRIHTNGYVGIGTTSPDTNLEVDIKNGADGNGIHITSTSTTNDPTLKLTRNGSADRFQFMVRGGAGSGRLGISAGTNLDSGLNLGSNNGLSIGTTTAAGSGGLLVDNDIKSNSRFGVGSGGSLSDAAIYKNSDTNTGIYWPGADQIALTTAGANRLHIASNGGVSLNSQSQLTTGGNARLSIIDSSVQLSMGASNSDMAYIRKQGAGQFAWQTYNSGNSGILQLQPYGGNVTINTTAAVSGHALSVSGKIGGLTYSDSYVQFTGGNAILKANDDVVIGYSGSLYVKQGGNVGVGTTDPKAQLQVKQLGINVNQSSVTSTSQYTCDSMSASDFRSARYTVQVTNTTDSTYQITEILLIHDGTTPSMTEYGTIFTGSAREASFDADINSGNVRLLATPASSDSMQFKVVRHSILV